MSIAWACSAILIVGAFSVLIVLVVAGLDAARSVAKKEIWMGRNDSRPAESEVGRRLMRPKLMPEGNMEFIALEVCRCDDRRGPYGGVCGNCGNAIPEAVASDPKPESTQLGLHRNHKWGVATRICTICGQLGKVEAGSASQPGQRENVRKELLEIAADVARRKYMPSLEKCRSIQDARIEVARFDEYHAILAQKLKKVFDDLACLENERGKTT